jgi:hypothetical protein
VSGVPVRLWLWSSKKGAWAVVSKPQVVAEVGRAGPAFSRAGRNRIDKRRQEEAAQQPAPGDYHT